MGLNNIQEKWVNLTKTLLSDCSFSAVCIIDSQNNKIFLQTENWDLKSDSSSILEAWTRDAFMLSVQRIHYEVKSSIPSMPLDSINIKS